MSVTYISSEAERAAKRRWYYKNKEKHRATQKAIEARNREWFKGYKSSLKCERCPESHISCLEFHHINGDKSYDVSDMIRGFSIQRIQEEIAKCIVLCKNCHAKEHASFS
jgi:hypothetical protein